MTKDERKAKRKAQTATTIRTLLLLAVVVFYVEVRIKIEREIMVEASKIVMETGVRLAVDAATAKSAIHAEALDDAMRVLSLHDAAEMDKKVIDALLGTDNARRVRDSR